VYNKKIKETYDYMLDNIQKEINGFYARYATKEGITLSEAKKRVSQLDIDAYGRKAKRYVKDKTFTKEANEEMRLYNATMKINRLELLKANIGLELVDGFDELQKYFDTTLTDRTLAEFKRQAGILGKSVLNNEKAAHSIVNASYQNAKFSDRIWMYQDMLKAELSSQLKIGLIQGRNPRELARHISKVFGVSRNNAERLMQTELARVQTEAQKQSYERNGYDQYEFIAEPTACPICRALDGKVFDVKKMLPGENASPIHPHCRCSTAAHMDKEEFDKWLDEFGGTDHTKGIGDFVSRMKSYYSENRNIDMKTFGREILDNLNLNDIPVNVKSMKDWGYCSIQKTGNIMNVLDYNLRSGDARSQKYRVKTAFHEAYHAKANGLKTDLGNIPRSHWLDIEETFAESSAHYMAEEMGITDLTPSYADKLINMLPRLKKLPEFASCTKISDFGKIALENRMNGVASEWETLYDEAKKMPHNWKNYSKQYFPEINKNINDYVDKMLENMPQYVDFKPNMMEDARNAMQKVENGGKLSSNEELVLSNLACIAMNRLGVR